MKIMELKKRWWRLETLEKRWDWILIRMWMCVWWVWEIMSFGDSYALFWWFDVCFVLFCLVYICLMSFFNMVCPCLSFRECGNGSTQCSKTGRIHHVFHKFVGMTTFWPWFASPCLTILNPVQWPVYGWFRYGCYQTPGRLGQLQRVLQHVLLALVV